ncbi:MAG: glycosyltransferase, partial [Chitinophagaceae bacterium]
KEGFGIVFIEALYYGLPVIGGNADGTVDALRNGTWGTLVTPGNVSGIVGAIKEVFNGNGPGLIPREEVIANFGFDQYQKKLQQFLN